MGGDLIIKAYKCHGCGKFQLINGDELQIVRSCDHEMILVCENCMKKSKYQKIIKFLNMEFNGENKEEI